MNTVERYNFVLTAKKSDEGILTRAVRPQYDKLKLKYSRQANEMYYTRKLDNEFVFVGDDFTFISNLGIRTLFTLAVYEGSNKVVEGIFKKADGKTDVDHKQFTVTITMDDEFKAIKDKRTNEYDVIEMLKGKEKSVSLKLYPDYQLYEYNQEYPKNVTHNLISGSFSDFNVEGESFAYENELLNDLSAGESTGDLGGSHYEDIHFMPSYCTLNITGATGYNLPSSWYGEYTNIGVGTWEWTDNYKPNPWGSGTVSQIKMYDTFELNNHIYYGICRMTLTKTGNPNKAIILYMFLPSPFQFDSGTWSACYAMELFERSNSTSPWVTLARSASALGNYHILQDLTLGSVIHTITDLKDYGGSLYEIGDLPYRYLEGYQNGNYFDFGLQGTISYRSCYCRNLYYYQIRQDSLAFKIESDTDRLAPKSKAYKYGYILKTGNEGGERVETAFVTSSRLSSVKGDWEYQNSNGQYYLPPTDNKVYQPICVQAWTEARSVWVDAEILQGLLNLSPYVGTINDFYDLGDLIAALLHNIREDIVFEANEAHSQFFYAPTNPVTGLPNNQYLITQKSNLLQFTYDYPAWKGVITFDKLFTMLKNVFNCYYDIYKGDDSKWHMRIEHIMFYMNGRSYTQQSRRSFDLTTWYDAMNRREIAFRSNNWEYNSDSQASRYEFKWMDTQSNIFLGYPIIIPEEYLIFSEEKTEQRYVDSFSVDINFMLATSQEVSSNGFLLAEAFTNNEGELQVVEGVIEDAGRTYIAQNYTLSYVILHPRYFPYNVYSKVVNINNGLMATVHILSKLRRNSVTFNRPNGVTMNPLDLFRTLVGYGEVEGMTIDLTSNKVEAELNYETETEE